MNEDAHIPPNAVCEQPDFGRNEETALYLKYAALLSVIPLLWIMLYVYGAALCKRGDLADSDCYMRLLRVEALHDGGPWYDPVVRRENAPYGQTSHWTRPFDVLLLLGAMPVALFMDFRSALFWWGVVVSPLLLFATIIALQWATRPILGRKGSLAVGFLYVAQPTLWACFQPGRPDHHSLLIFVFALAIGLTLRMILKPLDTRLCYIAGMVSALAMWINVESMVPVGITLAVLGALWVIKNGDFSGKNLHYAISLFIGMGFSLVIERSWHTLLAEEYDRLSIVHVSIFGIIALLWLTISALNRHTRLFCMGTNRLLSVPACVSVLALAILLCFSKFYQGPFADMDPRLVPIWLHRVSEAIPLISKSDSLIVLVQLAVSIVVCLSFFVYLLLHRDDREERCGWVYIFLVTVLFSSAAIFQYAKWSYYAQTAIVVPMTGLMNRILTWRQIRKSELLKAARNVAIKLLFVFGPLSLGVAAEVLLGSGAEPPPETHMRPFCEYLNTEDKWRGRQLRILADLFEDAEILYRTRHEVIGTPYQRNQLGILDTYDIMTAEADQDALELIRKRGIDMIVLRPGSGEPQFYSKPEQASTFYQRLCKDTIPDWLHKVELPSDLSASFLLFEVIGD
jgi:hypothetical protein